jgi:hypothetical protein
VTIAPRVLTDEQRALVREVLNRLVPARPGLAGAGDLDVGTSVEATVARSAPLRRQFLDGLSEIALAARRRTGRDFLELEPAARDSILRQVEEVRPAFFAALVDHTYRGYYSLPVVLRTVGAIGRPPQPLGHELPPFDPTLLDQQRQRSPFWRRA